VTIKHDYRCVLTDSEHCSRQVVIENHKKKKYETLSNQTLKALNANSFLSCRDCVTDQTYLYNRTRTV